jgi:hypothetical protein
MNATKIERNYKNFLHTLHSRSLTAEEIRNDYSLYNELAEKTYEFLTKVALLSARNRNLMKATGYEFDMFADDIIMHILNKLDFILACEDDYRMPFLVTVINHEVVNICRKWERTYPSLRKMPANPTPDEVDDTAAPKYTALVSFLDDMAWNLIADDNDIEENMINMEKAAENHADVLRALQYSKDCSRFELVSLLATKVIPTKRNRCMKTGELAEVIDKLGLMFVSEVCFKASAVMFDIAAEDYFADFTNDTVPSYSSHEELCDKISKASNNCAVKLCRKMGATRMTRKRVRK